MPKLSSRLFGFGEVRVRGSHHFLRHSDGRAVVVPVHAGETIGPGLMSKILRTCELMVDEFVEDALPDVDRPEPVNE